MLALGDHKSTVIYYTTSLTYTHTHILQISIDWQLIFGQFLPLSSPKFIFLNSGDLKSISKWLGIPHLVVYDTLNVFLQCLVTKLSVFEHLTRETGGHLGFDLSRPSEVKFDFPPHLKINLMTCPSYARNFMLFSLNAQLFWLSAVL